MLLVEDDMDDVELLTEALKDNNVSFKMDTIKQGDEVLPHLEKCVQLPEVIILDLNLPKMHGREILPLIKSSSRFKDIPVVILTTSSAQAELDFCLKAGAHTFLTKPYTVDSFRSTVAAIVAAARPLSQI
jgi:CheY-like chemotaxis protein